MNLKLSMLVLMCCSFYSFHVCAMDGMSASERKEEKEKLQQNTARSEPQVASVVGRNASPRNSPLDTIFRVLCLYRMQNQDKGIHDLRLISGSLLPQESDPNGLIPTTTTLLHTLVEMGDSYLPIIKMLVGEKGARFDVKNGSGETALDVAQRVKNAANILNFFKNYKARSPLHIAFVQSSSSSSSLSFVPQWSSSSTTTTSTVLEVPASLAEQISSGRVRGSTHRRTISNSLLAPVLDVNALTIPVTEFLAERVEPTIKEAEAREDDDGCIYASNDSVRASVRAPQAKKLTPHLSIDLTQIQPKPARERATDPKTPNNSAGTSGKNSSPTHAPNVDDQFLSVPSDGHSDSHRSDSVQVPNAPPNSANSAHGNTGRRSAPLVQQGHQLVNIRPQTASPNNDNNKITMVELSDHLNRATQSPVSAHPIQEPLASVLEDVQKVNQNNVPSVQQEVQQADISPRHVSPDDKKRVDLLALVAGRLRSSAQSPISAFPVQALVDQQRKSPESPESIEQQSLPNTVQTASVVEVHRADVSLSHAQDTVATGVFADQKELSIRTIQTPTPSTQTGSRQKYMKSPAVVAEVSANTPIPSVNHLMGPAPVQIDKRPWYIRLFCCGSGKSQ